MKKYKAIQENGEVFEHKCEDFEEFLYTLFREWCGRGAYLTFEDWYETEGEYSENCPSEILEFWREDIEKGRNFYPIMKILEDDVVIYKNSNF